MALSISDIAKSLQLSEATVSRALSGKGRISNETRQRVKEFAIQGGYVPNSIAQSLVTSKSNTIAFLMTYAPMDDNVTFFRECLTGICKMANATSYDVIVINSDKKDEVELQRLIAKRKVDGVMLNRELDPAVINVLDQFQTPYVLLGYSEDTSVNQVDTDKVKASEEMVSKLIHKGINKIAYIGEYDCFTVNKRRVKGFIKACEKNNAAKSEIFITQNMASQDEIDNAVKSSLKTCECIVTNDDFMCLRVMNALGRMGISVPGQIKLASMYHSYLLDVSVPRITSINHKSQDVGENAAKMLINILENNGNPKRGNKLWIDYEIILCESTAIL